MTVRGPLLADFLDSAFGSLPIDSALNPFSASAHDGIMSCSRYRCLLPRTTYTPGGLRGGGAIHAYTSDTPIAEMRWRFRIKHQQTLAHYLQEVTCLSSLRHLPLRARALIMSVAKFFEPCLNDCGTGLRPTESLTSSL